MASDGRVEFDVVGNTKGIRSAIDEATNYIEKETKQWDKSAGEAADNMESKFSSVLKKIVAGFSAVKIGKALLDFGKDAIQAASDLEEVQNVVDVTFGVDGAAKIQAWADKAGEAFGLTETQAKKFTSTLGAMMKSAGMTGPEIVNMSTDLAGLAADMASFYNLDFEEAFQKIRSGISGETEPLKQLGINMSVANLNAYALQQGLSKTFEQMSQGEQTMLRYQYLMSATADAQGDFARTSDGYANSMRTLQTNIESLKTSLGKPLLDVVTEATSLINNLVESFLPKEGQKTYLDQIAAIDLEKTAKLEEIKLIKAQADELVKVLESLGVPSTAGADLETIANGANALGANTPGLWSSLLTTFTKIDGLENLFKDTTGKDNIMELANALGGASLEQSKADAWSTFLGALSQNADALTSLTGKSAEDTKKWLEELAEAANTLDPSKAEAWDGLLDRLLTGLPGLADTEEGRQFLEGLATNFLAMGNESEEAQRGLSALGYSTEEIEQKQATWLATCKELVKTIPGLSSIIDTNTGEIKGGIPALKAYADEWERTAKYQAEVEAIREKRKVYEDMTDPATLQAESIIKRAEATAKLKVGSVGEDEIQKNLDNVDALIRKMVEAGYTWEEAKKWFFDLKTPLGFDVDAVSSATFTQMAASAMNVDTKDLEWFNKLKGDQEEAVLAYAEAVYTEIQTEKERPLVLEDIEKSEEALAEATGKTKEEIEAEAAAAEEAAKSMTTLEKAATGDTEAMEQVKKAVDDANAALKDMADYAETTHKAVESSVNNTVKGFDKMKSNSQTAAEKASKLAEKLAAMGERTAKNATEWDKLNSQIEEYNSQTVTAKGMKEGLQSQLDFMEDYLAAFEAAKAMGLSTDMLSFLADGSMESYEWLKELTDPKNAQTAGEISQKWDEVQQKKKQFTDTLTGEQLSMDETFQAMKTKAEEAVAALNLSGEAADNTAETIKGIAEGISREVPSVATAVDSVLAELDRLNNIGFSFNLGPLGSFSFTVNGSHETGLDFVPFDHYLAELHEGEGILTAEENRIWQNFKRGDGSSRNTDYDALGSVMRDNVRAGGDVFLDGRTVGKVISDIQGQSYRSLKRSGWQS